MTTWTPPSRLPTRSELQPQLPHDVEALVRAGHLLEVSPGQYRRAPRRTPDTAPTVRALLDHCTNRIAVALLDSDAPTARTFHHAARLLHASVGAGDGDPDEHEHEHTTATTASRQQPTPHRQDAHPQRQSQTPYGTAGVRTAAAGSEPSARRTGAAMSAQQTTPAGLSQYALPQDHRRCFFSLQWFFGFGHGSFPLSPCRSYPAGVVEVPYVAGDLVAVWSVLPSQLGVKPSHDLALGASTPPPGRSGAAAADRWWSSGRNFLACSDATSAPRAPNCSPCTTQPKGPHDV